MDLKEPPALVQNYIKQYDCQLPVLLDTYGLTAKKYGVASLPKLFVIDQNGVIQFIQEGYDQEKLPLLKGKITALLGK